MKTKTNTNTKTSKPAPQESPLVAATKALFRSRIDWQDPPRPDSAGEDWTPEIPDEPPDDCWSALQRCADVVAGGVETHQHAAAAEFLGRLIDHRFSPEQFSDDCLCFEKMLQAKPEPVKETEPLVSLLTLPGMSFEQLCKMTSLEPDFIADCRRKLAAEDFDIDYPPGWVDPLRAGQLKDQEAATKRFHKAAELWKSAPRYRPQHGSKTAMEEIFSN